MGSWPSSCQVTVSVELAFQDWEEAFELWMKTLQIFGIRTVEPTGAVQKMLAVTEETMAKNTMVKMFNMFSSGD